MNKIVNSGEVTSLRDASEVERTRTYNQEFSISYQYSVIFTRNIFSPANSVFRNSLGRNEPAQPQKVAILIDGGLEAAHPDLSKQILEYANVHDDAIKLASRPRFIPGGELCKNDPSVLPQIQSLLVELGMDRHSFVVAIGGGAFLDVVGYAAATVHRGIRHIRMPTTVLSQNDSGVGVKNGVNAFGQKNLLGAFAPPYAVLNDSAFLDALDERDKLAGMAEAVKVALIRDGAFFEWLVRSAADLRRFDGDAVDYMIRRCAELHMKQIANGGDPFERGSARPLDFGHWAAHKLEILTHYELRHGEAVAIGIALDTRYSVLKGLLNEGDDIRVCNLIHALGLPTYHRMLMARGKSGDSKLLSGLREFREHLGGELTITLLRDLGVGVEVHSMDEDLIMQSIVWLSERTA